MSPPCLHQVCAHACNASCEGAQHATLVGAYPWVQRYSVAALQRTFDMEPCSAQFRVLTLRQVEEVGQTSLPLYAGVSPEAMTFFLCRYQLKERRP